MKMLHGHKVVVSVIIFLNGVLAIDICLENQYQCPNGKCIPPTWLCDGEDDCGDEADEKNCKCDADQFKCTSGRCIDAEWICDGDKDCGDGSDEQTCAATTVATKQFQLPPTWEPARNLLSCHDHEFRCTDGTCIMSEWICDGFVDCVDAQDEDSCTATTVAPTVDPGTCPATQPFAFDNGRKCCEFNYDNGGVPLTLNSMYCQQGKSISCPSATCTGYNLQQRKCNVAYPYAYYSGRYCCRNKKEENVASKGEFCDGGSLSVKSTCCDGGIQMCGYGLGFVCTNYYIVHPCDEENKGGCSQKCKKVEESFVCECNRGFALATDGKTCNKEPHPCDRDDKGGCSQKCRKMKASFACRCNRGFVLEADGKTCIKDVHPCDQDNKGGCSQKCRKMRGSFVCRCNRGFLLEADGKTCSKDVHPCDQVTKGGCSQKCRKVKRSFVCKCNRRYKLAADGKTCNKVVHPCDQDNKGGCEQRCKKMKASFVCRCKRGFVLAANGKTCNHEKV